MSSPEDSHASLSAMPEIGKELRMTVTSGRNIYEQYGKFSPLPWLVKTLLESSVWHNPRCSLKWKVTALSDTETLTLTRRYTHNKKTCFSTTSVKTLKKKVTKSRRLHFQLQVSERRTEETGFGLLPTPTASEGFGTTNKEAKITKNGTVRSVNEDRSTSQMNLLATVKNLFPTPTQSDWNTPCTHGEGSMDLRTFIQNQLIPTPATRDYKGGNSMDHLTRKDKSEGNSHQDQLPNFIKLATGETSQLNPRFVLEMMGFPPDWTELPFLSGETNPLKPEEMQ